MTSQTKPNIALGRGLRSALLGLDVARRAEVDALKTADRRSKGRNDLVPPLELVRRDPAGLRLPSRNVRAVKPGHVKEVMNAINELGFSVPVIINSAGAVIDGVVRVRAAQNLGLAEIPCVVTSAHTVSELRLLRLATNRLGEKGAWDIEALRSELKELVIEDAPITVTGFADFEIDGFVAADAAVLEKGRVVPEGQKAIARAGDLFVLEGHRVFCGDALDTGTLTQLMDGRSARLVATDEPYNVPIEGHVTSGAHREFAMASGEMSPEAFLAFNDRWIGNAAAHLVEGGVLATFIDWRGLPSVTAAAMAAGLAQINLIVWAKTNAGMGGLYRSQHELLPLFKKGDAGPVNNIKLGQSGRWRSNVWTYPGASTIRSDARQGLQHHPTVKPVAMLAEAILDLTNRGEVVLDPFLGSGSTLIACAETKRICYGIEIDPLYVDVIVKRFEDVTGKPAVLDATGETFAQLATRRRLERTQPSAPVIPPAPDTVIATVNASSFPGRARLNRKAGAASTSLT